MCMLHLTTLSNMNIDFVKNENITIAASDALDSAERGLHASGTATPESDGSHSLSIGTNTHLHRHKYQFTALIVALGLAVSSTFMSLGIREVKSKRNKEFREGAQDMMTSLRTSWDVYQTYGLWIHQACEDIDFTIKPIDFSKGCSRESFRRLYEYILSLNVTFQSAQYMPNVTHANRYAVEDDARAFFEEDYSYVEYQGFAGFEPDPETRVVGIRPRSNQSFYYPVHMIEPVQGNEKAIDLDLYSSSIQRKTLEKATETWKPALTDSLKLVQDTDPNAYSVILHHPGIPNKNSFSLGQNCQQHKGDSITIFDVTEGKEVWLGGAERQDNCSLMLKTEAGFDVVKSVDGSIIETIYIADREWKIVISPNDEGMTMDIFFVAFGGIVIFLSFMFLACWFFSSVGRSAKMNELRQRSEAEKAQLLVETAKRQAIAERELNDFIAHEVRNPLSAAIAALSFVSTSNLGKSDDPGVKALQEDIKIIDSSLSFINELLRNMLDMHRAAAKQMKIHVKLADLKNDIVDPVASMLYVRKHENIEVLTDCPSNIVVTTDVLRLKQIALNLLNNSLKFVEDGFVCIRVELTDDTTRLCIEDSGPGIPHEKRDKLFCKFQESLDQLNQGTGIGLSLCKSLADLMGAEISLDESYDSGVPGYPGTRFVVDLKRKWRHDTDETQSNDDDNLSVCWEEDGGSQSSPSCPSLETLPPRLDVLFVDDDMMVRKLFIRSVHRVRPDWRIDEAANGETALKMVSNKTYDLIFVDQYMASVQKQLLGTETVQAMRSRGCQAKISGLSANDTEEAFLKAGADTFLLKPFKCKKEDLEEELLRVMNTRFHRYRPRTSSSVAEIPLSPPETKSPYVSDPSPKNDPPSSPPLFGNSRVMLPSEPIAPLFRSLKEENGTDGKKATDTVEITNPLEEV